MLKYYFCTVKNKIHTKIMLFNHLLNVAVADSTDFQIVANKITSLSNYDLEELVPFIMKEATRFGFKILTAIAIFIIGKWLINKIDYLVTKIMEKRNVEISLRTFTRSFTRISLNFFVLIIVVSVIGIDTTSFVALFASAGVAIGMALSGTLQNFAGGVMILIFKPYRVGDFIEAQGQMGVVKEIQIINTIINTPDNKIIIIPNGGLSTGIINNFSKETIRRVDWNFGIAYGDDYDNAKAVLKEILEKDSRILKSPEHFIALHSLGDSSVNIVVRAWVKQEHYWDVYFHTNEIVYKTFPNRNLNIPFPQMDVHIHNNNK